MLLCVTYAVLPVRIHEIWFTGLQITQLPINQKVKIPRPFCSIYHKPYRESITFRNNTSNPSSGWNLILYGNKYIHWWTPGLVSAAQFVGIFHARNWLTRPLACYAFTSFSVSQPGAFRTGNLSVSHQSLYFLLGPSKEYGCLMRLLAPCVSEAAGINHTWRTAQTSHISLL
jgi:hypothetical protein